MYTPAQFLSALQHEFNILKHLHTKIDVQEHLDHQFTEHQRTAKELLCYLAYSFGKGAQLIDTGDMSIYANMGELQTSFHSDQFADLIDAQYAQIEKIVHSRSEAQLSEKVTLFGIMTASRMEHLVQFIYAQACAYKMQLFLQLKHAGLHDLKTANLWMGVDPQPQA